MMKKLASQSVHIVIPSPFLKPLIIISILKISYSSISHHSFFLLFLCFNYKINNFHIYCIDKFILHSPSISSHVHFMLFSLYRYTLFSVWAQIREKIEKVTIKRKREYNYQETFLLCYVVYNTPFRKHKEMF